VVTGILILIAFYAVIGWLWWQQEQGRMDMEAARKGRTPPSVLRMEETYHESLVCWYHRWMHPRGHTCQCVRCKRTRAAGAGPTVPRRLSPCQRPCSPSPSPHTPTAISTSGP
jgi:hypothetical protein